VRPLVEEGAGRDLSFYNTLRQGRQEGAYIEAYYGAQDGYFKHALVRQAWRCDAVLAVGDLVVEELRFLGAEFAERDIDLVYNGVPATLLSAGEKQQAGQRMKDLCAGLLGWQPDWVFTHVTRLVPSKGLWRDLLVLEHLDEILLQRGQRAVLLVLSSEVGRRTPDAVRRMIDEYGWPLVHREGWPDLSAGELEFDLKVRAFNARSRCVRVLFVNQFGWDRQLCGDWIPEGVSFADLRRGSDVEFGQSIYEPFGIAQVEPLSFGAVSVVSDVCGCVGFVERSQGQDRELDNFIVGEYTRLPSGESGEFGQIDARASAHVEAVQSRVVAAALAAALEASPQRRQARLRSGYALAEAMSWERVAADWLTPVLRRLAEVVKRGCAEVEPDSSTESGADITLQL
jgi:glycosyltransferase involved in cell wall biosynthesis